VLSLTRTVVVAIDESVDALVYVGKAGGAAETGWSLSPCKQRAPRCNRYLRVEMPEHFLLEVRRDDETWIEEVRCLATEFERLDDGA
jgi:hypothetical protein